MEEEEDCERGVYPELDALSNILVSSLVEGCEPIPSEKEVLEPILYMVFKVFSTRLGLSSRRGLKDSGDARLKSGRKEIRKINNGHDRK